MDDVVPNTQLLDAGAPRVVLAGVTWPVPPLAIKQNRIVLPLLIDLFPEMQAAASLKDAKGDVDQAAFMKAVMLFSENTLDKLINVVYTSLLRGHPALTREQFDNMAISPVELFAALDVVVEAVGLLARKKEVAAPGEA